MEDMTMLYLYETMRSKDVIAKGVSLKLFDPKHPNHEFRVLKGSKLIKRPTVYTLKDIQKRQHLEDHLSEETEHYFVLTEDVVFHSPSHAASVILGKEVDGYALWVDEKDRPLSELLK